MTTSTSTVQASASKAATTFPKFGELPYELREQIYQDAINAIKLVEIKAVETGEETLDNWGRPVTEYTMRLSSLHVFLTLAVNRESRSITKHTLRRETEFLGKGHFTYHFSNIRQFIKPNYPSISFKVPFQILNIAVDVRSIHDPSGPDRHDADTLYKNTAKLVRILSLLPGLRELILIVPELEYIDGNLCSSREVPQPLCKPRTTSLAASRLMHDMGTFRYGGVVEGSTRAYKEAHDMKSAIENWSRQFTIRIDRWDYDF